MAARDSAKRRSWERSDLGEREQNGRDERRQDQQDQGQHQQDRRKGFQHEQKQHQMARNEPPRMESAQKGSKAKSGGLTTQQRTLSSYFGHDTSHKHKPMPPPIGRKASVLGATAGLGRRGNVTPTLSRQATAESADSHELRAQLDQLKHICHRILGQEHRHLSTLDRCLAELSKVVEDVFNVPNAFKSRAAADNRDCMEFRQTWDQLQSLPNQRDLSMNLDFFQNKIKSAPEGAFIEDMLSSWASRHDLLERHHHGMSFDAVPLQVHERITISNDHECMDRFVRGYSMMLNFYGFRLTGPCVIVLVLNGVQP
ncbi:uncharacterized protein MONBRDRAFT_30472 [Monosiga brevicollis MX1]|uniref:Opioid growth factor receptor (OGFr) conserved domain-containing protein n=1 Tax=Monosiga brevicollis TaxID=81824 RepID=A9VE20_MONBE|nr:uncharacterized protein MONBRDRAFT_30472 [Monosiga brevicollis MX1]EDQ84232.1 predicted protein [Monosiga brevicollis MX1]|eukprot:XP_001750956.1 hypothetical protein [Monosiga brevicollis MX1]